MTIRLPRKPGGEEYEDLVAAVLRILGYFTETRIVLREQRRQVLELDAVATPLGRGNESKCIYEAKKSGPSFPDIFKLYGQRTYLNVSQACLVSMKGLDPATADVYNQKAEGMGVRICSLPVNPAAFVGLANPVNNLNPALRIRLIAQAWFQQIARRVAYAAFKQECAENLESGLHQRAKAYDFAVQQSFFEKSPLERANALYDAYLTSPRLTGDFVTGIAAHQGIHEQQVWRTLTNTHEHLWLQHIMILEHVGRTSIVKNALDDILGVEEGEGFRWDLLTPPRRFVEGLRLLKDHTFGTKLPFLFQAFVELFGGFVFTEDSDELGLLASVTDIPADHLMDALRLLDHFFAPPDGTVFYQIQQRILCMKLIPGFVRGGGCFLRGAAFSLDNYGEKYPDHGWLLSRWHNALYHTLEPVLRVIDDQRADT